MANVFTLLVSTLRPWLYSSSCKRNRDSLSSPWVLLCDLLWMIKWGKGNGIAVLSLGFKKLFLPPLWCFWHHYKDIFCPKKRKNKSNDLRRGRNMRNRDAPAWVILVQPGTKPPSTGRTGEARPRLNAAAESSHQPDNTQNERAAIINNYGLVLRLCIVVSLLHSSNYPVTVTTLNTDQSHC